MELIKTIRDNRHLIITWVKFDIEAKYIETKLGLVWLFLEPIFQTLVYTFIFSALIGRPPRGGVPFIIFFLAGVNAWQFINLNWIAAGPLFVRYSRLLSDVKISADAIVIIEITERLVDLGINFLILIIISMMYGYFPTITYLGLPILLLVYLLTALGGMFFLSSLGVFIRDITNITSMVMRLLFFLSGVIITPDMLPAQYSRLLLLNPILHIIEATRSLIIYSELPTLESTLYMLSFSLLLYIFGYTYFRKRQGVFVDFR